MNKIDPADVFHPVNREARRKRKASKKQTGRRKRKASKKQTGRGR